MYWLLIIITNSLSRIEMRYFEIKNVLIEAFTCYSVTFTLQNTSNGNKATSKNRAGHNSTCWTVSCLLFSRGKVLLHTVYILTSLLWTEAKFQDSYNKISLSLVMFLY